MSTLAEIATKALHDDFAAAKYGAAARDAIRTAIGMIFRGTSLARGDYVPAPLTLPSGALGITLTDAGLRIKTIFLVDTSAELTEARIEDIAADQQSASMSPGAPRFYAITGAGLAVEGVTIVVSPIPDRDYELQIVGSFSPDDAALNDDGDTIPLPSAYTDLLVHYARSELFGLEGDQNMSDFHLTRFNGRLQQLRGDLQLRSSRVRRTAGTWSDMSSGPRFHHPQGLF